jgi:hypothetical protein
MSVNFGANTSSGPIILGSTYSVEYAPESGVGTYKIAITLSYEGSSEYNYAWILSNGTLIAFDTAGQNSTGSNAQSNLLINASPFLLIYDFMVSPSSNIPPGVQAIGQSNVTIGSLSMTVTTYEPTTLPLVFSDCLGNTFSMNTLIMKAGIVPGANVDLLTYFDWQGTETSSGTSQPYSAYIQVTEITVAALSG